jgi:flagellin
LTSANQQLGNVGGLLSTAQTGLNNVSNMMGSMRDVLVKLSDESLSSGDRKNYIQQYKSMLANVKTFIQDSSYNGKTLIGDMTVGGHTAGFGSVAVVRDGDGHTYEINSQGASAAYHTIAYSTAAGAGLNSAGSVAAFLTTGGSFITTQNTIGNELNAIGSNINYVQNQTTYNNNKINSLNSGLGSLIDADLAKESAQLTALQIRQQLGTQALSLANQAPQTLLSLFK